MLFDGGLHGAGAAERCRGVACGGFRAAEGGVEPPCGGIAQAVKLESNDCGIGAGGRYCAGYLFGLAYIVQPGTFEVVWTAYEVQRRVELAAHQYVAGENAACQVIYVGLVVDEYGFDAGFAHYVAEAAEPQAVAAESVAEQSAVAPENNDASEEIVADAAAQDITE